MTKQLHIGRSLYLPIDAVTQTFGIIARKGAGKTYTATKMAEEMHDAGAQIVALDPVGIWYGLRLGADGKSPGISIPVLGGDRGDIPLEHTAGALVADMIMDTGTSAVVDVSLFRKGQRKVFVADFAEQLFHRAKRERMPLHLFLEEAQTFAPQKPGKGEERMLGAMEDIVRLGRNYGLGASMISQRPQSINKEVLNQTEALLVMQLNGPHERKAINEWVVDKAVDVADMIKELPGLEIGTGFLWSPQWLRILQKVYINKKRTFDASATPKVGQKRVKPKKLTPVDLDALQSAMAETIEKTKANDPKELQRQIIALKQELEKSKIETKVQEVEVLAVKPEQIEAIREVAEEIQIALDKIRDIHAAWGDNLAVVNERLTGLTQSLTIATTSTPPVVRRHPSPQPARSTAPAVQVDGISKPQLRILNALARLRSVGISQPKKAVAAAFSGYKVGGAFNNNVSALKTAGLISYPSGGLLALTDEGLGCVNSHQPPTTLDDLHDSWRDLLTAPQVKMMDYVIRIYPGECSKERLADESGYTIGGAFNNNVSRLRSIGLVDYPERGMVKATDILFPEGLY